MTRDRKPWQEAPCYYNNRGICLAKIEPACMCQNGTLEAELKFEFNKFERLREIEEAHKK